MSEYGKIKKQLLTDIADAIRAKKETTAIFTPEQMAAEIEGIAAGQDTSDADALTSDIVIGKTAYVDGEKITGTVPEYVENRVFYDCKFYRADYDDSNINVMGVTTSEALLRKGAAPKIPVAAYEFGNATAEDVVAGKTFTSAAGLKVVGTRSNTEGSGGSAVPSAEGVEF